MVTLKFVFLASGILFNQKTVKSYNKEVIDSVKSDDTQIIQQPSCLKSFKVTKQMLFENIHENKNNLLSLFACK